MTTDQLVVVGNEVLLGDLTVLVNVHSADVCLDRTCIIHSPTEHHMRSWPLVWRDDRRIFERLCTHSIGHPDPDQYDYWQIKYRMYADRGAVDSPEDWTWETVHGCDGCCDVSRETSAGA